MFDINFIRYDADHSQRIVVDYQDHRDDTVEETAKAFGLRVLTCNHAVADIFGVDVEADENVLRVAQLEAIKTGEHVFFIEFGSHSSDWFKLCLGRPARSFDSGFCGIIVVPHDAWLEAMPRKTYAKRFVHQKLCEAFNERVTANLNGWVYEARAETDDGCFCFPGFLDQEGALAAAMAEFPDIKYREEDFAAITTYTLREKRS